MTRTLPLRGREKVRDVRAMAAPSLMSDDQLAAELRGLMEQDKLSRRRWYCDRPACDGLPHVGFAHNHARGSQHPPDWLWRVWMLLTGRGWGKTRTSSEQVREWIKRPGTSVAVVAKKHKLVLDICFNAPKAGLLAIIPPEEIARTNLSEGSEAIWLKNGSVIRGFSSEVPDNLRGYAFDKAWLDEYAAWPKAQAKACYDMIWFCLRESPEPQVLISTTPKPLPHVKDVVERGRTEEKRAAEQHAAGKDDVRPPAVVLTRGHTMDNRANLSDEALDELESEYQGTRLGKQELSGELLEDVEGALWQAWMLDMEGFRLAPADLPDLDKKVVAVDPAVTSTETADYSALVVAGRDFPKDVTFADQRPHGYALHMESGRFTPTGTMQRAAELYHLWDADYVVLEANNGGEYLATVLRSIDATVQYRIVNARRSKRARAAPVAMLYEQGRFHHVGPAKAWDKLETQQTTYIGLEKEDSPDELDALVWAATDLLLDRAAPATKTKVRDRRLSGSR